MRTLKYILSYSLVLLMAFSCSDDNNLDYLDNVTAPSNISALFQVTQDNTGLVTIIPNSTGAVKYNITLGDDTSEPEVVNQGQSLEHIYAEGTYSVIIEAVGITGLKSQATKELVVSFKAPENLNVVISNDAAISKQVNVTATADYAISFDVYFREEGNDTPVSANIGEIASYIYQEPGTYSIRVVVKSAAIETTEYVTDFEVTEISQPLTKAPTPPFRADSDVISLYGERYESTSTAATVDMFVTDWSVLVSQDEILIDNNKTLVYSELNYAGIITESAPINASGMEYFHIDVWSKDATSFRIKFVDFNGTGYNNGSDNIEFEVANAIDQPGEWVSLDIPLSDFTGVPFTDINQIVISNSPVGTVFLDNMYFYKASTAPFNDGLLTNGDFEFGSDSWIVGTDDNSPVNVVTDSGNTYYSVNVAAAGNSWDVNMSQKVEIIQGETYTLIFDAWSDTNRSIVSGIGLSAAPWSSAVENVNITPTRTTYSLTLVVTDWGAIDARVIFDMGAEAGMVNIDNVSLFLGDGPFDDGILINGDFEAGSDPWIIGTDDNAPVSVVTDSGNTYYSVDVAAAGNTWDVNMSQKVEIIQGTTYTLAFDAWSDVNRSIVSGIGLSAAPWSSAVETVNITPTRTTYTLTLTATDWGAVDARVIFDMGAEAGQVNIDNVSLKAN